MSSLDCSTELGPLCAFDPWIENEKAAMQHWRSDSARLFSDSDEVRVKIIDVGQQCNVIRDNDGLSKALARPHDKARFILIPQEFSWGSLTISEQCMRTILYCLNPFPVLIGLLHTFGQRTSASNESVAGYKFRHEQDSGLVEMCYLLKCVELHGREGVDDPYSIRQFLVYDQQTGSGKKTEFMLVNHSASRMLRDKMALLQNATSNLPCTTKVHVMMVAAAAENWGSYVDWLEAQLYPLATKAYVAIGTTKSEFKPLSNVPIDMIDMQRLQTIQDKLHQASHLLDVNATVASALSACLWTTFGGTVDQLNRCNRSEMDQLRSLISTFELERKRTGTLLQRAGSVSGLMQNVMSTRSLETLHDSSSLNARIAQLAKEDNGIMLSLSKEGRRDSRTLKTITILTLAYLPASFVSTLLSMGYITIQNSSLHFKPEMWIFFVLSVSLLVLTFGLWLGLDKRRQRREISRPSVDLCEKGTRST